MSAREIKECRADLFEDVAWLSEQVSSPETPLSDKVRAAMILWDLSEKAREALEPFKEELRDIAVNSGEDRWSYSVENIQATVVRPTARVALKTEADISSLRGTPEYENLIEERTTYRVRHGADTANLSDSWLDVLQFNSPTPRVNLTRKDKRR